VDCAKVVGGGGGAAGEILAVAALKIMSSESKSSFFRHSGWMVVSTFLGGIFMVSVQIAAQNPRVMEVSDFNTFIALLGLLIMFGGVPSAALQTIFAQQAAAAVTDEKMGELTATLRALLRATFGSWLVVASLIMIFAGPIAAALGVNDPAALRVVMLAVLAVICLPTFKGVLQGLHRFAPLGWLQIIEGVLRLAIFFLFVLWLKWRAVGAVWAACTASYLTLALAIWRTRDVLFAKTSASFSWKVWLIRGAPLTLAMGTYVCMSSLDRVFTKSLFFDPFPVKLYNNAMLVGYAIGQFISPISLVMFPTIVRNLALSKKTDALLLTVGVTGIFGCLAALGCTLFPGLPLAVLHFRSEAAPMVPWFAWSLLPLTLANVLILNLMARGRYYAAQWLFLVPVFYALALMLFSPLMVKMADITALTRAITDPVVLHKMEIMADLPAMTRVIQILGCSNLALFGVAAWFTWRKPATAASGPD
jgi:O-antigen/teichoic acid export membrane protein